MIDAEPHPAGDVRLWQRHDGWVARVMTPGEWYAHKGRSYIAHQRTCRPVDQHERASS